MENRIVPINKIDSGKHIIKGVVYKPNEKDTQGDWMTEEDIEIMAYLFMKRSSMNSVDTSHTYKYVPAYVCESYLAQESDPDGFPKGSWIVCIKIEDETIWTGIENGDYAGLSMGGLAVSTDEEPSII